MQPLIFNLGPSELLIILAIVLLLFGGSRLAGLGKSTGRALKEFKEETKGLKAGETPPAAPGATAATPYQTEAGSTYVPTAPPASTPPQSGIPYGQPPQQTPYQAPPQQTPYAAPPQHDAGQPANGADYGQPPQGYSSEYDARRDV